MHGGIFIVHFVVFPTAKLFTDDKPDSLNVISLIARLNVNYCKCIPFHFTLYIMESRQLDNAKNVVAQDKKMGQNTLFVFYILIE